MGDVIVNLVMQEVDSVVGVKVTSMTSDFRGIYLVVAVSATGVYFEQSKIPLQERVVISGEIANADYFTDYSVYSSAHFYSFITGHYAIDYADVIGEMGVDRDLNHHLFSVGTYNGDLVAFSD